MYNFSTFELADLFKIRDACEILARWDYQNKDLMAEINKELQERERKQIIE